MSDATTADRHRPDGVAAVANNSAFIWVARDVPALILAPMDGITDAPMRALQGETGAFAFAVSEYFRVSSQMAAKRALRYHVPELLNRCLTSTGLPVQLQLLGGDPERMARSAELACAIGATAIDLNFGCPAPTVNRHDGGATLLKYPVRIREIVRAVRDLVPPHIPVSAKLRLGWDSEDSIFENAEMAAEGGAAWLTIHGRTRLQGYAPPVDWRPIGVVREHLAIPVVANGDIWSIDDYARCREQTGCCHFMLGRGAIADPRLPGRIAHDLGLPAPETAPGPDSLNDWIVRLRRLVDLSAGFERRSSGKMVFRLKQWLRLASSHGSFPAFEAVKHAASVEELFAILLAAEPCTANRLMAP